MNTETKQTFTRRITQANRTQLVVIVYEMLLVYLEDAINSYHEDKKEEFKENVRMARKPWKKSSERRPIWLSATG